MSESWPHAKRTEMYLAHRGLRKVVFGDRNCAVGLEGPMALLVFFKKISLGMFLRETLYSLYL